MLLLSVITAIALNLIPAPKECTMTEGTFTIKENPTYSISASKSEDLSGFRTYLEGMREPCFKETGGKTASVRFSIGKRQFKGDTDFGTAEGYIMEILPDGINVRSATTAGAFYALQTLTVLNANYPEGIPCCRISDEPAYMHRGLLLDVSRHFRSVEFIYKQLDAMALMKMNRMHFHFDDTVGWRLELETHPELTGKAAFRKELKFTRPSTFLDEPEGYVPGTVCREPECYGGYYSKEQMRGIIAYAKARHIEILPEIELPGHGGELRVMHPEMFCQVDSMQAYESVCPGKDETVEFFKSVLDEVIDLFPYEYIHIGGDEANKKDWENCPDCRRRMEKEGLRDTEELQSWMIREIKDHVTSKGKKIIGWDEIMQGGLVSGATVMSWRDPKYGKEAMEMGHDIIMTPQQWCYLDYYQSSPHAEPNAIGGYMPVSRTYSFDIPESEHMLGIQGNLWTEFVIEDDHFEYMLYPRSLAIAELGWGHKAGREPYGTWKEKAISFCDYLDSRGYTTFDLRNEVMADATIAENKAVNHIARGAGYTYSKLASWQSEGAAARGITDGRQKSFVCFEGPVTVDISLDGARDVHTICAVVHRHEWHRTSFQPSEIRFYVSGDGKDYRLVDVRRPLIDDAKVDWGIVSIPVFCDEKGIRNVRVEMEPSRNCPITAVAEIIVN